MIDGCVLLTLDGYGTEFELIEERVERDDDGEWTVGALRFSEDFPDGHVFMPYRHIHGNPLARATTISEARNSGRRFIEAKNSGDAAAS